MPEINQIASVLDDGELLNLPQLTEAAMTSAQSLCELGIKFCLNLLVSWIIIRFLYYPKSCRRDYFFTFLTFSSAMLLLLYMMGSVDVGVGLTLGLFAIFGIIRYRTETVPIREMTYLFVIIALAAVNGLSPVYSVRDALGEHPFYAVSWGRVAVTAVANLLVVGLIWLLENTSLLKHYSSRTILYDRIDLLVPARKSELMEDLQKRTGTVIEKIEIGNMDFLKDAAYIRIFFRPETGEKALTESITKLKSF